MSIIQCLKNKKLPNTKLFMHKDTKNGRREFLQKIALAGAAFPLVSLDRPATASPIIHPKKTAPRDICLFSKHLQWMDYEELGETLAEMGFDGAELTVRPGGHVKPKQAPDDLPKAVEAIQKAGVKVPSMVTNINDVGDTNAEAILKTAGKLGITHYRMAYYRYDKEKSIEESLAENADKFKELAALNKEAGIHGAYQNHAGGRVGGPVWDLWHLVHELDPKYAGVQYDVRHATVEGGYSWPLGFQLLHPFMQTTAIKDFLWQKRDGKWRAVSVPLGTGMVDFDQYFELIKQYEISGPISLHFEYPVTKEKTKNLSHKERKKQTMETMTRDLNVLKDMLEKHGLLG